MLKQVRWGVSVPGMGAVKVPAYLVGCLYSPRPQRHQPQFQAQLALHRLQQEVSAKALGQPTPHFQDPRLVKRVCGLPGFCVGCYWGLDPPTKAKLSKHLQ